MCKGVLTDCAKEKRDAAKKRSHVDRDELVKNGKWLTPLVCACVWYALGYLTHAFEFPHRIRRN